MGVDQAGQRPQVLSEGGIGLASWLGPSTVDHVANHRLAEWRLEYEPKTHESDGNCRLILIMASVRRLLLAVLVLVPACASPPSAGTTSVTDPAVTIQSAPVTTTTVPTIDVEIQDCQSPPVTFSPLCEAYDLLETWYMDSPVDPDALAAVALRGLAEFTTTDTEEPPRTLFCAIPDDAFAGLCEELGRQVAESLMPVGTAVEAAVAYMVDFGLDPFTYYLPPDQAGSVRLNGIVGGIGVVLDARDAAGSKCAQITDVCDLEVVIVLEDNPGFEAGLEAGDVITSVDGEPVVGQGFTSVVSQIAGDEAGEVELTIDREGGEIELIVQRTELEVPTVEAGIAADDVGYIKIPDFELDIPRLVANALDDLTAEEPETIVVDLRDNPGGFVDAFVEVADLFVDGGIVMTSEATAEYLEYEANPGGVATSQRLVVLVNQGTASAAEILAGALRDRRDAVLVGTNTFGKDTVQIPFELRNGGELYVAVARWSTPNGDTVTNGGLVPDHEISWPPGVAAPEVIEIALEAIP
jgi:carboxyl-terminal processing protease